MKTKRLLAFMLSLMLIMGLCACSSKEKENNTDPTATVTEAPVTTESAKADGITEVPGTPEATDTPQVTDAEAEPEPETEPEITEAPVSKITVTDMIGREVEVTPGSYTKIVCIGAGALRMYTYIGSVELLCGVEDIDNTALAERPKMFDSVARPYVIAYGDSFSKLPSCGVGGPNAQAAEAEKILSCNPDIVISEYEDVEKEDALQEQLGVPVITLKAGPGGVFDPSFAASMELLGTIFKNEAKAEQLVNFIAKEREEINNRTSGIADEDKPGVYICGLGNWGTTNHLMTAQNYIQFNIANVKNVVNDLEKDGIQAIEEEKFVSLGEDMDIIIMDAAAIKNIKPLLVENPALFNDCKAFREGKVYLEMAYNAYYTNYEIALINCWFIAKTVYPDAFSDIDIKAKTDEVTKLFLGKELSNEIYAAPSSFGGYGQLDSASLMN
ncbi:MAG: ABC transporter substrate-binding protein [Lachnospiraceae bacterium]|nr:ABC transporter substrate-binding protein [Lachnospiraceae bacterium]